MKRAYIAVRLIAEEGLTLTFNFDLTQKNMESVWCMIWWTKRVENGFRALKKLSDNKKTI